MPDNRLNLLFLVRVRSIEKQYKNGGLDLARVVEDSRVARLW